jgi:hypothetical protein
MIQRLYLGDACFRMRRPRDRGFGPRLVLVKAFQQQSLFATCLSSSDHTRRRRTKVPYENIEQLAGGGGDRGGEAPVHQTESLDLCGWMDGSWRGDHVEFDHDVGADRALDVVPARNKQLQQQYTYNNHPAVAATPATAVIWRDATKKVTQPCPVHARAGRSAVRGCHNARGFFLLLLQSHCYDDAGRRAGTSSREPEQRVVFSR